MAIPKTKAQLVEENNKLKEGLRGFKSELEAMKEKKKGDMPLTAYIPYLDKSANTFRKIKINFNPITGQAQGEFDGVEDLNHLPEDPAFAVFSAKQIMTEHMNSVIDQYLINRNENLNKPKGE
jgi:hypothetical protein